MIGAPKPSSASWAAAAATSCPPSSRSDSFFALSSAALRSFCVFITPIPSNKRCQSTRQIRTAPVAHAMHQVQEATVGGGQTEGEKNWNSHRASGHRPAIKRQAEKRTQLLVTPPALA